MRRARPAFVAALGVTVVGVCVALVLPVVLARADQARLGRAEVLVFALPAPPGGISSTQCHGDGQVGCWLTTSSVEQTAREVADALGRLTDERVDLSCEALPTENDAYPPGTESCFVRVRFGDRGTFVFIDPVLDRTDGAATPAGALVNLSAS